MGSTRIFQTRIIHKQRDACTCIHLVHGNKNLFDFRFLYYNTCTLKSFGRFAKVTRFLYWPLRFYIQLKIWGFETILTLKPISKNNDNNNLLQSLWKWRVVKNYLHFDLSMTLANNLITISVEWIDRTLIRTIYTHGVFVWFFFFHRFPQHVTNAGC